MRKKEGEADEAHSAALWLIVVIKERMLMTTRSLFGGRTIYIVHIQHVCDLLKKKKVRLCDKIEKEKYIKIKTTVIRLSCAT